MKKYINKKYMYVNYYNVLIINKNISNIIKKSILIF